MASCNVSPAAGDSFAVQPEIEPASTTHQRSMPHSPMTHHVARPSAGTRPRPLLTLRGRGRVAAAGGGRNSL
jgi:hypothetical protein